MAVYFILGAAFKDDATQNWHAGCVRRGKLTILVWLKLQRY
jgi:hypothetical protein